MRVRYAERYASDPKFRREESKRKAQVTMWTTLPTKSRVKRKVKARRAV
jgi:hypothetical protein